jgi:hypothetical protein
MLRADMRVILLLMNGCVLLYRMFYVNHVMYFIFSSILGVNKFYYYSTFCVLVLAPWWPNQESDWTEIWSVSYSYIVVHVQRFG